MSCLVVPYFDCDNQNVSLDQAFRETIVQEVGTDNKGVRIYIACGGGGVNDFFLITDAAIIAALTLETNWTPNYIGSVAGILQFSYYKDLVKKIAYFFDGTTLVRYSINDLNP